MVDCENSWCRGMLRVPPMELGVLARVVPICVGPLVSIVVCMWGTPAGLGGPHVAWRSRGESGGRRLANRMEHFVRWHPGGCLANRLHMLSALLPLWLLLGVLWPPALSNAVVCRWSGRPRQVSGP